MDSETKIANIRVLGNSVFPDTTQMFFTGEDATLKQLLEQRVPMGLDKKVGVQNLPDTLIYERSFSGAKISAISSTVIAKRDEYQYIPFDQKVYDHDGNYLHQQVNPPGGYKFCVHESALYGIALELKFTNSPQSQVTNLIVAAKIERGEEATYNLELVSNNTVTAGTTEFIFTGVVEATLEEGDCISFVLKQDAIGGMIEGGFATQATIHKVIKVPDGAGGSNGHKDGHCPNGYANIVNDIKVTAPEGYEADPTHDITLAIDSDNCSASLTGTLELPKPSQPECEPNALVSCISTANASPEDLGLVFSQEQIMAIVGGFTTLTKFNQLQNNVTKLEGYITQIFGQPDQSNGESYDGICNIVDGGCL